MNLGQVRKTRSEMDEKRSIPVPAPDERDRYLDDVRRRLESGELDSPMAVLETAAALLDGDRPKV